MSRDDTRQASPRGLASRLFAAQTIVMLAGAVTAGLVATIVGPTLFREHLLQAGQRPNSPEMLHIEMAYRDASLISLGLGLLISVLAATAVTWFVTRRLRTPLAQLTSAARELSRGHYSARVPDVGSGTELDTLAGAFNVMAARMDDIEGTRRRMLADLAHELRTPIATLTAYHDGLHDGIAVLGPESQTALSEQTHRLARLADDIDEVSSAEEGRLSLDIRPEPLDDLFTTTGEALRERYREQEVALVVDTASAQGLTLEVDRQRIAQVLTNLLTNALRHTPGGGAVTVSARRAGDEVEVIVHDTGDGIGPDQLPHVFERFYRGDPARSRGRSGSGIGLTISKAIVDAHSGAIRAESPGPGHGSTFVVTLPAAAGHPG
ncbi:MAG: ATP-binding protein [Dermatophilus congolensis]|nr:ATP-binding protein [Dermatophilus congolensis]